MAHTTNPGTSTLRTTGMFHTHDKLSWLFGILVGLAAGASGIATAMLVAATSSSLRSPVLDVGDRVVDRVPSWAKDLAISWFGTNDKIALLVGIGSLLAIFAATIGIIATRGSLRLALGGAALFGLLGALSALGSRTDTSITSALPSILGAAVVAAVLMWARATVDTQTIDESTAAPTQRRNFLTALGALGAVAVGGGLLANKLEGRFSAEGSREEVAGARELAPAPPTPVGAQAENAASFYTPNDDFYRIDTALTVPQVPVDTWELKITGMVDNPITLTYDDIFDRGLVESDITLTCVSNLVGGDFVGTARWQGIRLDELLEEAGIQAGADQIVGRSVDGYTCGFPVEALDGRDALVAIAMNGEPLPLEHGFPARLIVPGIYGYASATKWLTEIEITRFEDFDHYWVPRGYATLAPIKMQTRIDAPRGLDRIPGGEFAIGGVAWAQPTGIKQVEISFDEGPWIEADMADEINGSTWRQWSYVWNAEPGRHTITARAIDQNGAIQTPDRSEPLPDGVTGHHSVVVLVDDV